MQLSLNRPGEYLFVRSVAADAITVIDKRLQHSFVLAPDRAIEQWPVTSVAAIDAEAIAVVLQLQPVVVVLGSGARTVFPHAWVMAEFLRRGIGIEVMDNAAAARTYNVLVSEGRRVVAAFILPTAAAPA